MAQKRILVVEDERPVANALILKLASAGYEAQVAYDGEVALDAVKKSSFDLIILDLVMPVKDGFYVLGELKKLNITTAIIVATNLSQEEDLRRAKELGATDYFVKSDTPLVTIVEKVRRALAL